MASPFVSISMRRTLWASAGGVNAKSAWKVSRLGQNLNFYSKNAPFRRKIRKICRGRGRLAAVPGDMEASQDRNMAVTRAD